MACGSACPDVRSALDRWYVKQTPMRLVARALDLRGDAIDVGRLYDWLSAGAVAVPDGRWEHEHHEAARAVRRWLENRPDVQKAVLMEGLRRCPASGGVFEAGILRAQLSVRCPPPARLWTLVSRAGCLHGGYKATGRGVPAVRGVQGSQGRRRERGALTRRGGGTRPAKRETASRVGLDVLSARLVGRECGTEKLRGRAATSGRRWLAQVRSEVVALKENRAAPVMLFQMARAYFGDFVSFHAEGGSKGVEKLLRGDPDLPGRRLRD